MRPVLSPSIWADLYYLTHRRECQPHKVAIPKIDMKDLIGTTIMVMVGRVLFPEGDADG